MDEESRVDTNNPQVAIHLMGVTRTVVVRVTRIRSISTLTSG
jgi:hypothetical protein